jgi:hypothetical protein
MFSTLNFYPQGQARKSGLICHYPELETPLENSLADIENLEGVLAQWFGAPVILTATGKSAIELYFQVKGYHPYRTKVHVPPYFARPLMSSLGRSIFPVLHGQPGYPVIHYHQFGFPQRRRPQSENVLEDIAHSFFASENSGARNWSGEVAVFSLQKTFPLAGQAGGVVVHDGQIHAEIRARLEGKPRAPENIAAWVRSTLHAAYSSPPSEPEYGTESLQHFAYELVHDFPHPDPISLNGCPTSMPELAASGQKRKQLVEIYFRNFHGNALLQKFWHPDEPFLPFAIPHFGTGDQETLRKAESILRDHGVSSGVYHVDHNRNMCEPNYLPCLLLPSHQNISSAKFEEICNIVSDVVEK